MNLLVTISTLLLAMTLVSQTAVAEDINGTIVVAGRPVGGAAVALWKTVGKTAPKSINQVAIDSKGAFKFRDVHGGADGDVFYLTAKSGAGGAGALISVPGTKMPPEVVVNELTTVASVFTNARFINDTAISGNPLGLCISNKGLTP